MVYSKKGRTSAKTNPKVRSKAMTTDFGERKVMGQNFSKVVSLPKIALANLGSSDTVKVELVEEDGERFIKLTPSKKEDNT